MKKIAKPIIELSDIYRSSKKACIEGLNISVPDGDSYAVVHSNQDNISLLLDIIGGKVPPKKGKIFFKGDDITSTKNNFGVIRSDSPLPKKTVADFAGISIVKRGLSRSMTEVLVKKEIKDFGIEDLSESIIAKLPPEDAQKALIFAAYMCSHDFMVIDEPFGNLDKSDRREALKWLNKFRKSKKVSLLIFTQNPELASISADYVMTVDSKTSSSGITAYTS